jgi:ribosomal protein S18 acetylase RimI-like enzyme
VPNPLQITDPNADSDNPLAQAPSWADAMGATGSAISTGVDRLTQWLSEQRAKSAKMGLWNNVTGLPTAAGVVSAAGQTANALMMGTTAPGAKAGPSSPADRFWDAFDAEHAKSGLSDISHMRFFQHGPDEMEISHIGVDPERRGQGIGNTLMGIATEQADKHGVTLHASPASDADAATGLDSEALRDWYQRWGFDEHGGGDRLTRRPYTE